MDHLPHFEGIAIDRLDYSEFFNYDRDDGLSWVPINGSGSPPNYSNWSWGPARALRLSYRHTFNRLHQLLHGSARQRAQARQPHERRRERASGSPTPPPRSPPPKQYALYNNCNWLCRLDMMHAFDGGFSEGAALNSVAWVGLRTPSILWTYSLAADAAVLHGYFQQHLLMNVYPMAPMPLNDHAIQPGNSMVEQAYRDYAPLFDAMRGARWLLTARPAKVRALQPVAASVEDPAALINAFVLPRNHTPLFTDAAAAPHTQADLPPLLVPIMLANANTTAVRLELYLAPTGPALGWPAVEGVVLSALYPNGTAPKPLGEATLSEGSWVAHVPLEHGCALVRAEMRTKAMDADQASAACAGAVTNGTRPGHNFAVVHLNESTGLAPTDCQRLCCAEPRCKTWVHVPDGLFPSRPPGNTCWLKNASIALNGTACENGKPGCTSGTVNRSSAWTQ